MNILELINCFKIMFLSYNFIKSYKYYNYKTPVFVKLLFLFVISSLFDVDQNPIYFILKTYYNNTLILFESFHFELYVLLKFLKIIST